LLLSALAGVRDHSFVDEVTGIKQGRDREELQRILEAYINPELIRCLGRDGFQNEFNKELFRLHGWQYSPHKLKGRKF